MKRILIISVMAGVILTAGTAYAVLDFSHQKEPVAFYDGHTHDHDGGTHGAPSHSGGTDRYGCHNGSVPYHCH